MSDHPVSFVRPPACRAVLAELADLAADPSLPLPPHAAECARCADSIAHARRVAGLLAALPRPSLPESKVPEPLASSRFLAGVYERANAQIDREPVAAALRSGLVPAAIPASLEHLSEWQDAALRSPGAATGELVASLGRARAPGWLWARIRADLRAANEAKRMGRRRVTVVRWAAAAMFLFAVSWAVRHDWGTRPRSPHVDIEFVHVTDPIASNDSPAAVFRTIAYTPTSGR